VVLNTLVLRLLFPPPPWGWPPSRGARLGLLNIYPAASRTGTGAAVAALGPVIWVQHVLVHAVPALWRLHRVHHADLDYDLTTGARFHPLEIVSPC